MNIHNFGPCLEETTETRLLRKEFAKDTAKDMNVNANKVRKVPSKPIM